MARSNNVLNVGFCPPANRNNVDTFASTLTLKAHSKEDAILPGKPREEITASEGPGVLICTSGNGTLRADGKKFNLSAGFIFFITPGVDVKIETESSVKAHMAVI
ncbi:hypothetical protein CIB48_g638 [Xylaria polymorpha]|nr:hypothetical protein CIB48_g638 [Xylaria polymorpha]